MRLGLPFLLMVCMSSVGVAADDGIFFRLPLVSDTPSSNSDRKVEVSGDTTLYAYRSYPAIRVGVDGFGDAVTYRLAAGALPEGVHLDSGTGVISGKPVQSGQWDGIVIQVTDGTHSAESVPLSLRVIDGSGLWIAPVATQFVEVSIPVWLPIEHGAQGQWSLASDSAPLPAGLVVGESGVALSGTAVVAGRYDGIILERREADRVVRSNAFSIEVGTYASASAAVTQAVLPAAVGDGQVLEITYPGAVKVTEISLTLDEQKGAGLATYSLESSVDGVDWQTVLVLSSAATPRTIEAYRLPVPAIGSRFRLFPTSPHAATVSALSFR